MALVDLSTNHLAQESYDNYRDGKRDSEFVPIQFNATEYNRMDQNLKDLVMSDSLAACHAATYELQRHPRQSKKANLGALVGGVVIAGLGAYSEANNYQHTPANQTLGIILGAGAGVFTTVGMDVFKTPNVGYEKYQSERLAERLQIIERLSRKVNRAPGAIPNEDSIVYFLQMKHLKEIKKNVALSARYTDIITGIERAYDYNAYINRPAAPITPGTPALPSTHTGTIKQELTRNGTFKQQIFLAISTVSMFLASGTAAIIVDSENQNGQTLALNQDGTAFISEGSAFFGGILATKYYQQGRKEKVVVFEDKTRKRVRRKLKIRV